MIKLALKREKLHPDHRVTTYPWASCAPFVENDRAILIHRPRTVSTFTLLGHPHIGIGHWCGNHVSGTTKFTFLEAPPEGAILCEACERNAVAAGLPTADSLAGRHVHRGRLKAVLTCGCTQEQGESDAQE